MKLNDAGLALIKECEGLRLEAYICPAGKLTIGYGHTASAFKNQKITAEQAEHLLRQDLKWCEESIKQCVKVKLSENQYSALISFIFNVGNAKFKRSTLLKYLNDGHIIKAADEFNRWVWSKGKKLNGLVTRRQKEKELFLR